MSSASYEPNVGRACNFLSMTLLSITDAHVAISTRFGSGYEKLRIVTKNTPGVPNRGSSGPSRTQDYHDFSFGASFSQIP